MAQEIVYTNNAVGNFRLLNFATGSYNCHCCVCGKAFIGDKRAVQCLACAIDYAEKSTSTGVGCAAQIARILSKLDIITDPIAYHDIHSDLVSVIEQLRLRSQADLCSGCRMDGCNKTESSECKTCRRFYRDNYQLAKITP